MTEYTREIGGKAETARQFHIASFVDGPEEMSRHIRNHRQVENRLHRVLDATFRQDDCRIRNGNSATNFATINHAANHPAINIQSIALFSTDFVLRGYGGTILEGNLILRPSACDPRSWTCGP